MAQAITYNNLVDLFRAYQQNNPLLKRYGNGSLKDLESVISEDRSFPLMWSNLVQVDYPFQNNIYNTKNYTFNVMFMDILSTDKSNEQEVWSDSIQQAEDFLKWLNFNSQTVYEILPSPKLTTFTERFGDFLAGANISFQLQIDADLGNNCNTPAVPFPFNTMQITNIQ